MGLAERLAERTAKKKTDVTPKYVELMHKPEAERTAEESDELAEIVNVLGLPPEVVNTHEAAIADMKQLTVQLVSEAEIAEAVNAYAVAARIAKDSIIEALTTFVGGATDMGALAEVLLKLPLGEHANTVVYAVSKMPPSQENLRNRNHRTRMSIADTKFHNSMVFPEGQRPPVRHTLTINHGAKVGV